MTPAKAVGDLRCNAPQGQKRYRQALHPRKLYPLDSSTTSQDVHTPHFVRKETHPFQRTEVVDMVTYCDPTSFLTPTDDKTTYSTARLQ